MQFQAGPQTRGNVVNPLEARLAVLIVTALNRNGVEYSDIGLIAPYQSQVQHLRSCFDENMPELEVTLNQCRMFVPSSVNVFNWQVNSVDQYQGRDKSVIIYSCTKVEGFRNLDEEDEQDNDSTSWTILHDLRRLTVAVTRAKHKLIIIGHGSSLHQYKPFARLMDNLEDNQRYIVMPLPRLLALFSDLLKMFIFFSFSSELERTVSIPAHHDFLIL